MKRTVEEKLLDPTPGSEIAAARDYGIDLTLLVRNLKLTPEERLRNNELAINGLNVLAEAMSNSRRKIKPGTK